MPKAVKVDEADNATTSPKKIKEEEDSAALGLKIEEHFPTFTCLSCGDLTAIGGLYPRNINLGFVMLNAPQVCVRNADRNPEKPS